MLCYWQQRCLLTAMLRDVLVCRMIVIILATSVAKNTASESLHELSTVFIIYVILLYSFRYFSVVYRRLSCQFSNARKIK